MLGALLIIDLDRILTSVCRFLGVDVPSEPFPRKNAREDFMEKAIS